MVPVSRWAQALVLAAIPGALVAYAFLAFVIEARWAAGLAAAAVAWLLWQRHPRSRFALYVFASVVGLRAAMSARWAAVVFAVAILALLQTPAARRAWPRLTWRWSRRTSLPGRNEDAVLEWHGHEVPLPRL